MARKTFDDAGDSELELAGGARGGGGGVMRGLRGGELPRGYVALGMVLILGLAAYLMWLWWVPNYGAGVDEASYMLAAKGLATRLDPSYVNADVAKDATVFVPENMVEPRPGVFYPIYPIGYPLLCALPYRWGGAEGPFWVNPVVTLVGLVGVFFFARLFVGDLLALGAMFFLAVHPGILHFGVVAMSHASDFACSTWCLYFMWGWYLRPRWWKLAAAGFLAGYAVSIRYTEALLALPLGYLILLRMWDGWKGKGDADYTLKRELRAGGAGISVGGVILHAVVGAAAGVVALAPLLMFHKHAFGSIWTTGYSLTGHATAFSVRNFREHAWYAVKALWQVPFGLSIFFPAAVAGLCWMFVRARRTAGFVVLTVMPTLLLYMAYYWVTNDGPGDTWFYSRNTVLYVRFFVTLYPVMMVAGLMGVEWLAGRRLRGEGACSAAKREVGEGVRAFRPQSMAPVAAAVVLVVMGSVHLKSTPDWREYEGTAVLDESAVALVKKHLPTDGVILGDGFCAFSLVYDTDMTVFYPRYFSRKWVEARLHPADAGGGGGDAPRDFSPIRRKEITEALGGRTDEELGAILVERLEHYAKEGRVVGLVIDTRSPGWWKGLEGAFQFELVGEDEGNSQRLYRLEVK